MNHAILHAPVISDCWVTPIDIKDQWIWWGLQNIARSIVGIRRGFEPSYRGNRAPIRHRYEAK